MREAYRAPLRLTRLARPEHAQTGPILDSLHAWTPARFSRERAGTRARSSPDASSVGGDLELTHPMAGCIFVGIPTGGAPGQMLGAELVRELYELKGDGRSNRLIRR